MEPPDFSPKKYSLLTNVRVLDSFLELVVADMACDLGLGIDVAIQSIYVSPKLQNARKVGLA